MFGIRASVCIPYRLCACLRIEERQYSEQQPIFAPLNPILSYRCYYIRMTSRRVMTFAYHSYLIHKPLLTLPRLWRLTVLERQRSNVSLSATRQQRVKDCVGVSTTKTCSHKKKCTIISHILKILYQRFM